MFYERGKRKEIETAQQQIHETETTVVALSRDAQKTLTTVVSLGNDAQEKLKKAQQQYRELEETLTRARAEGSQLHAIFIATRAPGASEKRSAKWHTMAELATLYNFPIGLEGAGQAIGVIELGGGYRDSDLNAYFAERHLNRPTVTAVSIDHAQNNFSKESPSASDVVTHDIEALGSVAPAAKIVVYFAPNMESGYVHAITTAVHDVKNKPSVIWIGWGGPESSWSRPSLTAVDQELQAAAATGITIIASAGVDGAADGLTDGLPHADFPGSSSWVLSIGTTRITNAGSTIESETAWNEGFNGRATGGGVSDVFAPPDWQSNAGVPARKSGGLGRGLPDVAAESPLIWAGLVVLLNQALGHNLGYLNPGLYREIGPARILRPITEGNNGNGVVDGYSAGSAWNAVAGWGTPDGQKLLDWLRVHPSGRQ
jgi:kumamolisin